VSKVVTHTVETTVQHLLLMPTPKQRKGTLLSIRQGLCGSASATAGRMFEKVNQHKNTIPAAIPLSFYSGM
jgi:hypothetical protein